MDSFQGKSPFDDASGKQLIEFLKLNNFAIEEPIAKYLIAFSAGGGAGNTVTYASNNAQAMEASGAFNGTVIEPSIVDPVLGVISAINSVARNYALPWYLFTTTIGVIPDPVASLLSADFIRFKHNFIRANIGSAQSVGYPTIDPWDPVQFNTYVHNIGTFAKFAHATNQKGVLFDTERYNTSRFWGPVSFLNPAYTVAEYEAKYRELGAAAGAEVRAQFPGGLIALAVSYEQTFNNPTVPPENNNYWLQPHFLDGFHDAIQPPQKILNIQEDGYSNQTTADMLYDVARQQRVYLGSTVLSPNYDRVHEDGMSSWLDYPGSGFNFVTPTANYNTPAIYKNNILIAAASVPHYVFLYFEQAKWWNYTAGVNQVPTAYVYSLAEARAALP